MSDRGWCPFARQHRGAAAGPFGYPAGTRDQNYPLLFADHIMGGYKRTLDDDVWRHDNWVGVHGGIGRDGSLDQYASIFDASWGNGVAWKPTYDRSNAALAEIEKLGTWIQVPYAGMTMWALVNGGVNTINAHSISTEHEDENTPGRPWTPAQTATTIRWKQWCLEELIREGRPMPVRGAMLGGHFQIDSVNRSHCPGDDWPRAEILTGITEGDDMAAIQLVWVLMPNGLPGRTYVLGQGDPRWITNPASNADLVRVYGDPKVALDWGTLVELGAS